MTHSRYPAPEAERIWSTPERIARLRHICDSYTMDALWRELLQPYEIDRPESAIQTVLGANDPSGATWKFQEQRYGHDMVGFLAAYLERLPEKIHPYVHYGLTSSDLSEYDLHAAAWEHVQCLSTLINKLAAELGHRSETDDQTRAGRTHGQTAELTTLGHQFRVHMGVLQNISGDAYLLTQRLPQKSPGPTGYSTVRTIMNSGVGPMQVPSTQVIPRDWLLKWACLYLRLVNELDSLATFIRFGCRSEIGEFTEGAAMDRQGSSAMPGKRNPIDSEKVCGLARVARGHFLALAEVSNLWEDRDLSNSSTERIAVPELAGLAEHMTLTMTKVIHELIIDGVRIARNAADERTVMNSLQMDLQRAGYGPIEASKKTQQKMETIRSD